jgi:CBS domain-containing protein
VDTVGDVMVHHPTVLPADATAGDVRAELEDDHVHMVLLVEHGHLRGTLVRGDVPASAAADEPAARFAGLSRRTTPPGASAEQARQQLAARGERRLAVVDEAGRLLGLLCLKSRQTGFCSDDDVRSRRSAR